MSKNVTKLISPQVLCTSITKRVLSWFDHFSAYYYCMGKKLHKAHLSTSSFHNYPKSCSLLIWPFYFLFQTVWRKMSQNSNLREIFAQVSQIVFVADLIVLWLITTVWAKMSQNSNLREFCAQVSQILLLDDLTVFRPTTTIWENMSRNPYLRDFSSQVSQILS